MPTPKKGQTQLLKSDREKILEKVFMAIAKQAHEQTMPAIRKAFDEAFDALFLLRFNSTELKDAALKLMDAGLTASIKSFQLREYAGDYDQIGIDSGVHEFNQVTGLPNIRGSYKFAYWSGSLSVALQSQVPHVLGENLKYGDDFKTIRTKLRGNLVDALEPHREFAVVAATVRGVVMNAKSVEDLLEKAPEIKEVVLAIVSIPKPLPVVIDDKVSKVLSSLKPIEV